MIKFENVSYSYNQNLVPILKNISFHIRRGEFVGLMGPSGKGKSTIANIAAGFLIPTTGKVLTNQQEVAGKPSRKVMLISQEDDLFPWQTVRRHLEFALKAKDDAKVRELIALVRLDGNEKKYPSELSGGMKKRLSLARALAVNPELLILDEAFGSLDSKLKFELYADLEIIWNATSTTILMINHDIGELRNFTKKILSLDGNPTKLNEVNF